MLVSVDIKRIRNHISILQEEQKESQALVECLTMWHKQAVLDGVSDIGLIEKHLHIACNQVTNVQQRIVLLESIADEFASVKNVTAKLLEDAKNVANSSGVTF